MKHWTTKVFAALLALGILAAGAATVTYLMVSAPEVKRSAQERVPPLVEALDMQSGTVSRVVEAFGTVMPAREIEISPEVSGRIIEVHPSLEPGGIIKAGEVLIRIDPEEYELAVEEAEGALAEAQAALEVEQGRQTVAQREWELFGKDLPNAQVSESLALREPQRRQAEARILSARSAVKQAELDLKRTAVLAPFDVLVLDESVDIGQNVSPGSPIAQLAGSEEFWVRVSIPADRLGAVLEAAGSGNTTVRIYPEIAKEDQAPLTGRVVRHLGQVDPEGRMAQLLLAVENPLGLNGTRPEHAPLSLNSFVRAELDAGALENAFTIPRRGLRENGEVWVADANNELQVRYAKILWRQGETLALSDTFEEGDSVVVSPLQDLIPGMQVRVTAPEEAMEQPALQEAEQ